MDEERLLNLTADYIRIAKDTRIHLSKADAFKMASDYINADNLMNQIFTLREVFDNYLAFKKDEKES